MTAWKDPELEVILTPMRSAQQLPTLGILLMFTNVSAFQIYQINKQ